LETIMFLPRTMVISDTAVLDLDRRTE